MSAAAGPTTRCPMPHRSTVALLAVAALAALGPVGARAQGATESRLREALRSTTAQLRTAEDERARLQAGEAALKEEVAALRRQVAAGRQAPRAGAREVGELNGKLADANRRLAEQAEVARTASESLARCQAETQEAARGREKLQASSQALQERLTAAETRNTRLFQVGKEILDWLSGQGVAAALWAREPFLGLKRVELENAAEDYRDKLHEQRLLPQGRPQ